MTGMHQIAFQHIIHETSRLVAYGLSCDINAVAEKITWSIGKTSGIRDYSFDIDIRDDKVIIESSSHWSNKRTFEFCLSDPRCGELVFKKILNDLKTRYIDDAQELWKQAENLDLELKK